MGHEGATRRMLFACLASLLLVVPLPLVEAQGTVKTKGLVDACIKKCQEAYAIAQKAAQDRLENCVKQAIVPAGTTVGVITLVYVAVVVGMVVAVILSGGSLAPLIPTTLGYVTTMFGTAAGTAAALDNCKANYENESKANQKALDECVERCRQEP